jgi:hypothetical protein
MLIPGERSLNFVHRELANEALLGNIRALGPQLVYGGLLWYSQMHGWKRGWAYYAFKEIFGTPPRPQDQGEPICIIGTDLEEWCSRRKRK